MGNHTETKENMGLYNAINQRTNERKFGSFHNFLLLEKWVWGLLLEALFFLGSSNKEEEC